MLSISSSVGRIYESHECWFQAKSPGNPWKSLDSLDTLVTTRFSPKTTPLDQASSFKTLDQSRWRGWSFDHRLDEDYLGSHFYFLLLFPHMFIEPIYWKASWLDLPFFRGCAQLESDTAPSSFYGIQVPQRCHVIWGRMKRDLKDLAHNLSQEIEVQTPDKSISWWFSYYISIYIYMLSYIIHIVIMWAAGEPVWPCPFRNVSFRLAHRDSRPDAGGIGWCERYIPCSSGFHWRVSLTNP